MRVLRVLVDARRRLERQWTGLWSVRAHEDRRRRPLVTIADREVMRLVEDGALVWADDGGVLALSEAERARMSALPSDPRAWMAAGLPRARAAGTSFLTLAMQAQAGDVSVMSVRQAGAGLKLAADAEQAAASSGLSMSWDGVPRSRSARAGGGPPVKGAEARARLAKIEAGVGAERFALLLAACVDGQPLRRLEQRFGFAKSRGGHALAKALEQLADVYDGR
jgi:hypothetical protein